MVILKSLQFYWRHQIETYLVGFTKIYNARGILDLYLHIAATQGLPPRLA